MLRRLREGSFLSGFPFCADMPVEDVVTVDFVFLAADGLCNRLLDVCFWSVLGGKFCLFVLAGRWESGDCLPAVLICVGTL